MNAFALLESLGDTTSHFQDLVNKKDAFGIDLLDQDEFLSEVIAQQPRLLSLLLVPEAARLQLCLALGEWQGITDTEEKGMRYAHMCSEVFCMDVKSIQDFILSPEFDTGAPFAARLLAVLDRDAPIGIVPSQNLCKILSSLIRHRRKEAFELFKNHTGLVKRVAVHAAGSSPRLADVLWQFMEDESVDPLGVVEWLHREGLVPQLLARLEAGIDVAVTALSVLTNLVERSDANSLLVQAALSEDSVQQLVAFTFTHAAEANNDAVYRKQLVSGLEFVRTLLDWCVKSADSDNVRAGKKRRRALWLVGSEAKHADHLGVRLGDSPLLVGVSAQLDKLAALLQGPVEDGKFGTVRLEVGRLLSALLRTNNSTVAQRFLALNVLPRCLELFFDHTLLNLWHHEVLKMVVHVLEDHPSEELLASLFGQGRLLNRVVSSEREATGRRDGHHGHVYVIAQTIAASTRPSVVACAEGNAEWQAFAGSILRQLVEKNEYSQYAPDEGMRNATTASSTTHKVTDLQVDEPDAAGGKKQRLNSTPPAAAPQTTSASSPSAGDWAKFDDDDDGVEWAKAASPQPTSVASFTAFVPQQATATTSAPDANWASFDDDEFEWTTTAAPTATTAAPVAAPQQTANWATFEAAWPPQPAVQPPAQQPSASTTTTTGAEDWAKFDDDGDNWAKFG